MADEVRSLDLIGTTAPALSTTSDMPKVGAVKEPPPKGAVSDEELKAGEEKAEEKVETKEDAKDAKDEIKAEVKDEKKEDKDETPAWQKREITKARNRQREADARAEAAEARANATNDRLDKALAALEKISNRTGSEVETKDADPRPVRTAYDDPEKYEADLVAWSAKTAAKVTQAEIERTTKEREATETKAKTERETQATFKKRVDAWNESVKAGVEKYADYHEVAEADDVPITPAVANAILEENLESEGKGFEIAYYLGNHKDEAARIAALPTQGHIDRAIGRIAERLASQPVNKVSKAPPPPKPVGARSTASTKKLHEIEDMEEYAKVRNASLRASPH